MRKIKLDKETVLNANLINDLIEKHAEEKNRIIKMKNIIKGYINQELMYLLLVAVVCFQKVRISKRQHKLVWI